MVVFFFKQKTAYEMRISDWSSDVCSSDLSPCQFFSDMRRIWNAPQAAFHRIEAGIDRHVHARQHVDEVSRTALRLAAIKPAHDLGYDVAERTGVVWGKSGSVRVDLGGGGIINTKNRYRRLAIINSIQR